MMGISYLICYSNPKFHELESIVVAMKSFKYYELWFMAIQIDLCGYRNYNLLLKINLFLTSNSLHINIIMTCVFKIPDIILFVIVNPLIVNSYNKNLIVIKKFEI